DFAGTSYNNATNKSSNAELNATNTTNYNNIEVTHNNDKNGYAAFNFNLGVTGVVDNNTDATKGTGQNAASGTKTVQGAAGNSGTAGANYTSSGNNQVINYYVPTLTVDKYGRLTGVGTSNAWNLNAGVGLGMDASGNIVINDNASNGLTFLNGGDTLYVHLRDNNSGSIGGLMISNDELQINAPTCTNTSGGRLMWTGTVFSCQKITTSGSGTYGSNSIQIPVITVDGNGEITLSRTTVSASHGITISGGVISANLDDIIGGDDSPFKVEDGPSGPVLGIKTGLGIKLDYGGAITIDFSTCSNDDKDKVLWDSSKGWICGKDKDTILSHPASVASGSPYGDNILRVPVYAGDGKTDVWYYNWYVNKDVTISSVDGDGFSDETFSICLPVGPNDNYKAYAVAASVDGGDSNRAKYVQLMNGFGAGSSPCLAGTINNEPVRGRWSYFKVYAPGASGDTSVDVGFVYTSRN
ncbi:MAG: hypothetical protein LBL36_00055, partial [Clostridiales Family XIII bacterium]|nr:hypothetical protein [Clostridiales Family XIII bacterium]